VTEDQAGTPEAAEHLAGTIIDARQKYFQAQEMIRDRPGTAPQDARARAEAEEQLDPLVSIIRRGSGALAGYCARTAHEGTFTAREARLILIATGAGDQALTSLREQPEEMTETLRAFITNPLPLEDKLRMIAESHAPEGGHAPPPGGPA
jgi:hypothetical protein